jgi:putative heme transporter
MPERSPSNQRATEVRDAATRPPNPADNVLEDANEAPGAVGRAPDAAGQSPASREEMPRVVFTRRWLLASLLFVVSAIAFLYFVLPRLLGLKETWNRIQHGNGWWLGFAALLEVCSFIGYIALFRAVFVRGKSRIGWRESYQITMSGLAATRLFAAAGAGGIALTAWAVRRSGMAPRIVACRMVAFLALLYGVYMATLVVVGLGLYTGLIPGGGSFAITMVPAIFGAIVIAMFLSVSLLPGDFDRLVRRWTSGSGKIGQAAARLATVPAAAATGVRTAIDLVRSKDPYLLGAIAWWGFDIAVLWACFHAFGAAPPKGVIIMSYFVGMVGNTLPLPGGIGGVDGGMIGAFTAFGIDVEIAVVSVLAYRAFAFWLPTLPGAVAYLQLRRTVHRWQEEHVGEASGPALLSGASGSAS